MFNTKNSNKKKRRRKIMERAKMIYQQTERLLELYNLYGFECIEQNSNYLVFTYTSGYFSNAEIVLLSDDFSAEGIQDQYECLGFSVRVVHFNSIEETHNNLFVGFFNEKSSNARTKRDYLNFCQKQTERLGGMQYSFAPCKYISDKTSSDANIVSRIYDQIFESGPQLIIVEAAAGYGKTCTSYELINALISNPQGTVPIMTELSKNRRAQIFKYVLLSEIDSNFRGLTSELVTFEIKNGRVPLIIDGFDELLSKSVTSDSPTSEEDEEIAQTMLSTIAQLFDGDSTAKIVLTSRKSSISAGDIFNELAEKYLPNCEITRIQLITPSVTSWIGEVKAQILTESGINLDNIANPALLAFIAASDECEIKEHFKTANDILSHYFRILLTRERERQSLLLRPEEQLKIMRAVAKNMVDFDISSCTSQDLELILEVSVSETGNIEEYLRRYEGELGADAYQPSAEEFYVKLSHHALLDRLNNKSNSIGFINDFIFGYLIADCIVKAEASNLNLKKISAKFWDLMITAYGVCDQSSRQDLFTLIQASHIAFPLTKQLEMDIHLMHALTHDYNDVYCEAILFPKSFDFSEFHIDNSVFSECIFDGCTIQADTFKNCWFFGCHFYNVKIIGNVAESRGLIFNNCDGEDLLKTASEYTKVIDAINTDELYERKVLEQYWRPGSDHADRRRAFQTLFRGNDQQDRQNISDAIDRLFSKQVLVQRNNYIELNFSQMAEIKRILGK